MGAPSKMTITAFTDPKFTSKASGAPNPLTVWVNPNKYSYDKRISYKDRQAQGSPGPSPEYNRVTTENLNFELLFDATGVIPPPSENSYENGVSDILDAFLTLTGTVNGKIHCPNYLQVGWATLQFQCVLTSAKVDYTLFRPDGTPLRAKVNVSFGSYTSESTLAKKTNTNSPDMTHVVTVLAGDTLPYLCYKIYGDSGRYLEVARHNKLSSFRAIAPGTALVFPPLSGDAP